MSEAVYRQVQLRRPSRPPTRGFEFDTVWIPAVFARVGKAIRCGDDPRTWRITEVYASMNASDADIARSQRKRFSEVLDRKKKR